MGSGEPGSDRGVVGEVGEISGGRKEEGGGGSEAVKRRLFSHLLYFSLLLGGVKKVREEGE